MNQRYFCPAEYTTKTKPKTNQKANPKPEPKPKPKCNPKKILSLGLGLGLGLILGVVLVVHSAGQQEIAMSPHKMKNQLDLCFHKFSLIAH